MSPQHPSQCLIHIIRQRHLLTLSHDSTVPSIPYMMITNKTLILGIILMACCLGVMQQAWVSLEVVGGQYNHYHQRAATMIDVPPPVVVARNDASSSSSSWAHHVQTWVQDTLVYHWKELERKTFLQVPTEKRRTIHGQNVSLPNFILPARNNNRTLENEETQRVVLATICSVERLGQIAELIEQDWGICSDCHVSFAVYIKRQDEIEIFFDNLKKYAHTFSHATTIHVVLETPTRRYNGKQSGVRTFSLGFPHNLLRELALHDYHASKNSFFLLLDGDFRIGPAPNVHSKLVQVLFRPDNQTGERLADRLQTNPLALVVPAFDWFGDIQNLPRWDKSQVVQLWRHKNTTLLRPFHYARGFFLGHKFTNFTHWVNGNNDDGNDDAPSTYPVPAASVRPSLEPYVLVHSSQAPHYWTSFRGFGMNKQSFFHEFVIAGGRFEVLFDFWVLHPSSLYQETEKQHKGRGRDLSRSKQVWQDEFQPYLLETYYNNNDKSKGKPRRRRVSKDWTNPA